MPHKPNYFCFFYIKFLYVSFFATLYMAKEPMACHNNIFAHVSSNGNNKESLNSTAHFHEKIRPLEQYEENQLVKVLKNLQKTIKHMAIEETENYAQEKKMSKVKILKQKFQSLYNLIKAKNIHANVQCNNGIINGHITHSMKNLHYSNIEAFNNMRNKKRKQALDSKNSPKIKGLLANGETIHKYISESSLRKKQSSVFKNEIKKIVQTYPYFFLIEKNNLLISEYRSTILKNLLPDSHRKNKHFVYGNLEKKFLILQSNLRKIDFFLDFKCQSSAFKTKKQIMIKTQIIKNFFHYIKNFFSDNFKKYKHQEDISNEEKFSMEQIIHTMDFAEIFASNIDDNLGEEKKQIINNLKENYKSLLRENSVNLCNKKLYYDSLMEIINFFIQLSHIQMEKHNIKKPITYYDAEGILWKTYKLLCNSVEESIRDIRSISMQLFTYNKNISKNNTFINNESWPISTQEKEIIQNYKGKIKEFFNKTYGFSKYDRIFLSIQNTIYQIITLLNREHNIPMKNIEFMERAYASLHLLLLQGPKNYVKPAHINYIDHVFQRLNQIQKDFSPVYEELSQSIGKIHNNIRKTLKEKISICMKEDEIIYNTTNNFSNLKFLFFVQKSALIKNTIN